MGRPLLSADKSTVDSDNSVQICRFYDGTEGSCVRGVSCRFRHICAAKEDAMGSKEEKENAPEIETKGEDDEEKEEEANGAGNEEPEEKGKDAVEEMRKDMENVSIQQSGDKEADDDEDDMELIE